MGVPTFTAPSSSPPPQLQSPPFATQVTPATDAAEESAAQEVEIKEEVIEAAVAELEEQGLSRWFTDEDGVEREMTDAEWCWANRGNKELTAGAPPFRTPCALRRLHNPTAPRRCAAP